MEQQNFGVLPSNINLMNPVAQANAKAITRLVKSGGRVTGYQLSDGTMLSKSEGVAMAKQGGIRGVAIASRSGSEYLRSYPDSKEGNNLSNLPATQEG